MPPTVYGLAGPSSRQDGAGRTQQAGHSRQDKGGKRESEFLTSNEQYSTVFSKNPLRNFGVFHR